MIERASPAQLRKALEIAEVFKKTGLGFVPMPVANSAEFEKLAAQSLQRLAELIEAAEKGESSCPPTNMTGADIEQYRPGFEAKMRSMNLAVLSRVKDGKYKNEHVEDRWQGWLMAQPSERNTSTSPSAAAEIEHLRDLVVAARYALRDIANDAQEPGPLADCALNVIAQFEDEFAAGAAREGGNTCIESALYEALRRLRNECDLEGLRSRAGFDCWLSMADKALDGSGVASQGDALDAAVSSITHKARNPHNCAKCGEVIAVGETYVRKSQPGATRNGGAPYHVECFSAIAASTTQEKKP